MATPKPSAKARRSAARLAAVQALYQLEQSGTPLDKVISEFVHHRFGEPVEDEPMVEPDAPLFGDIVRGTRVRSDEVDALVSGALDAQFSLSRLDLLLRCVMQAGAWELLANLHVPAPIVISEYVNVTRAFFGGKEPAMVNAVLDRIAREQRPDEPRAG
ncbi:transcription antitermination factor NusB [Mycobacterium sp. KBS0706]|uniref:transcription antitermination factor NusB n=1 Tax=Mycobacterium sp. KBS0706 TaxID=2578109 RepID=UPI00110FD2D2|nr:transcription antitermination factor NusB [Mycobacterium sp. KBS0706]TSD85388.1 transcription antitermination factor NusB [Mycobacterium sp. KBS0706]